MIVNGQPRHIIGYLADFLFPRERAVSPVKSLSGGERNRLMLARLFARPANVLVMDEPTNDLDIETLELLEELIADFPGTVLLVSHDRAFLDNIVTSTLAFEGNGRVVEYVGGWGDYLRQREQGARSRDAAQRLRPERGATVDGRSPTRESESPRESERRWPSERESGRAARPAWPEKRKLSFKEQREFETLPARIEALEEEQRRLTEESESRPTSTSRAAITSAACSRASSASAAELDAALARWLELEERAMPRRLVPGRHSNDFVNSSSIARRLLSWSWRVPVPVKCGCVITGASVPRLFQSAPVHSNQPSFS